MIKHFSPYDAVAEEYYDPSLHPTCANFRQLGHRYLAEIRRHAQIETRLRTGRVLETGAGFSMIGEIMSRDFQGMQNLTIQDASEQMLSHSIRWQNWLAELYVSDARQLRSQNGAYDAVFSFLADPYNDQALWKEISRVLTDGGFWVITTPSHHWAKNFRSSEGMKSSRFQTRSQEYVDLPSFTYPISQMVAGVEQYGPQLRNFRCYTTADLQGPISKKLHTRGSGRAVLDCFMFEKSVD